MKKIILALLCLVFLLSGCRANREGNNKITVAVSIVPQATFVEKVCGDKADIVTLIPAGASAETYEPTVNQMKVLEEADIYFSVGVPAEENSILPSVHKGTEIRYLWKDVNEVYPDLLEHGERDPHIWLSPKRVIVMISSICDTLCSFDPENTDYYKDNAEKYIEELNNLNTQITQLFDDTQGGCFLTYHPAYSYFADDYKITAYTLEEHGKEADAKRLAEMTELALDKKIDTVFYQSEASSRQAIAFAESIGGTTAELEPLSADYINAMLEAATKISKAMK